MAGSVVAPLEHGGGMEDTLRMHGVGAGSGAGAGVAVTPLEHGGGMGQVRLTADEWFEGNRDVLVGLRSESLSGVERRLWVRRQLQLKSMLDANLSWMLSTGAGTGRTAVAELVNGSGMSSRDARRAVRVAQTLEDNRGLAAAMAAGEVSTGHAEAMTFGVSAGSQYAANHDPRLVDAAREQPVDVFRETLAAWQRDHDDDVDGAGLARRQHQRRRCAWSTTVDGMVRIDAELAPDAGAIVTGAIGRIAEKLWRDRDGRASESKSADSPDDCRTVAHRNADALLELAQGGATGNTGTDNPTRTRADIVCVVDHAWITQKFEQQASGADEAGALRLPPPAGAVPGAFPGTRRCETDDGVPLTGEALRRLACDAGVLPAVMGGDGQPLDLGRRQRTVTPAQRTALIVRDGGCIFPGCDRPPSWSDAHHIIHWLNRGPTDLWNLCLLCSNHHHTVHDGTWTLRHLDPDAHTNHDPRITFTDPDGRLHEPDRRTNRKPSAA